MFILFWTKVVHPIAVGEAGGKVMRPFEFLHFPKLLPDFDRVCQHPLLVEKCPN